MFRSFNEKRSPREGTVADIEAADEAVNRLRCAFLLRLFDRNISSSGYDFLLGSHANSCKPDYSKKP